MNTRSQSSKATQQPAQKAAATQKTMENLETELNHAIQSRGFRISERLPLRERLTRYIDLTCRSRVDLDTDELNSVSELILMKYSPTDTNETITPSMQQQPVQQQSSDAKLDLLKDICTKRNIQWKDELYDMYLSYRKSCGSNGKNRYDIMNTFLDKYANGITNKRRSPRLATQ